MILFLFLFLLLYGGMHFYAFSRVKAALALSAGAYLPLLLFLTAMTFAPLLVHLLEAQQHDLLARRLAYVAYVWMGFLFLFFSASLMLDFYMLLSTMLRAMFGISPGLQPLPPLLKLILPVSLAVGLSLYSFFAAQAIRVERLIIRTPKLPAASAPLRLAQISDLHLGLINRETFLQRVIDLLNQEQPDLLVCTGDLLDGEVCRVERVTELWRQCQPPLGKYAITGNHEYYAGIKQALGCIHDAGFRLLRGERIEVASLIELVGVDDPTGISQGETPRSETELLSAGSGASGSGKPDLFTILLKHRPAVNRSSLGFFDLQLSGHTHKGQIFPFNLLTKIFYPQLSGYFPLGNGASLYVSRGTGSWGPPMRLFAPPEITIIELIPTP